MLDTPLTQADQDFLDEVRQMIEKFLQGSEQMLELAPMNSYRRRLIHNLSKGYGLTSQSVGDGEERFVCLIRTEKTSNNAPKLNKPQAHAASQIFDFGDQVFFVVPQTRIVLRADGSVGVPLKSDKLPPLDERVVESGEFRVRQNKIVCPGEKSW